MADLNPPDGFAQVERRSPFLDLIGPLWVNGDRAAPVYGLQIEEHHANSRGDAHGGC